MNVFKEMGCSVAKVSAYPRFLNNRKGKVFGYGVLLLLFYFILAYVIRALIFWIPEGGLGGALDRNVPDFELHNGILWVEETCYVDAGGSYLDIDTDAYFDMSEAYSFSEKYQSVIIMDAEKIFLKSNGQIQAYWYTDFGDFDVSRADLKRWIPMIYVASILFAVLSYIFQVALFFFAVLFVALLGLLFNSILKANLTFGQVYLLGIYSRTLSLGIKAIVKLLDIDIPFFWVINFGISLIYLYLAIKHAKMENNKIAQQGGGYGSGMFYGTGGTYGQDSYGTGGSYQGGGYGQGNGYGSGSGYQGQGGGYGSGSGYQGQGGGYGSGSGYQGQGGGYGSGSGYDQNQGSGYSSESSYQGQGNSYGQGSGYGQDSYGQGTGPDSFGPR
ncbi:MAG: DUF1189 domain-containing protein [Lachnospiraceae bacterium]|nr:DUF1189 domain-containing protein [Lachnospiraceae bacterium]